MTASFKPHALVFGPLSSICRKSSSVDKDDVLQYDLGNLSAFDAAPIDTKEFGYGRRAPLRASPTSPQAKSAPVLGAARS